jgi:uncharacterized repeat protein (TIGR01451 family)
MLPEENAFAKRLLGSRSRVIIFVASTALVLALTLVSRVALSNPSGGEKAPSKLMDARDSEGATTVGAVFVTPTERDIKIAGKSAPNTSEPMPQAGSTLVTVNFDDVPPFTDVSTRYKGVVFSSPGLSVYSWPTNYASSPPHSVTRGTLAFPSGAFNNHFADFQATFPQPVNDLKFYIIDCDNFGTIGLMDIYQNGVLTRPNVPIPGGGGSHPPIPFDAHAAGINDITKVVIHNITDAAGLTFDDFSFTITAPTPTPTPTPAPSPTPPPAPTDLRAVPDEESAVLSWSTSAGAARYLVKRSGGDCATDDPTGANKQAVVAESSGVAPTVTVPVDGSTTFTAKGLCSGVTYTYVVSAVGTGGESANSEPVFVTPLPKPGCDAKLKPPPSDGATGGFGWVVNYTFSSGGAGLEVSNISLNGRLMAEWMSAPYYVIAAHDSSGSRQTYGQLWINGSNPDGSLHSTLVGYKLNPPDGSRLVLEATYKIDHIPGAPKACLTIAQDYEFYRPGFGVPPGLGPPSSGAGPCEPSGTVPCAKFRPMVSYEFHGGDGELLDWINVPERHHYQVKGATDNTVGVFQDNDTYGELLRYGAILGEKRNPVTQEFWSHVIGVTTAPAFSPGYRDVRFDNFHQTNYPKVQEPSALGPGCPECLHDHWRWGALVPNAPQWGSGFPLVPPLSRQTVDIGVVRYPGKVGPQQQWISLVQGNSLRNVITKMCPVCIKPIVVGERGVDPVFWFSPTGYTPSDTFFYHTAWFNPHPPNAPSAKVDIESALGSSSASTSQDGPLSVLFGDVYQTGTPSFAPYDLSSLPPLPAGYSALGNTGYSIDTTAVVSGPHVINFSAASVTDQNAFNNLRIFHLEPDPFEPDTNLWVDATILPPNAPAPDFSSKILSAQSLNLGVFVIGNLVQNIPPSTDVADIAVSSSASANPITAGNQLTYTIQVTNNGPQIAHEVALRNGLSLDVSFASATSVHGSCKEIDGTIFCSLNSLNVGETATIAIVVTPTEGSGSFPTEGKNVYNGALAKAREADGNIDNNAATETTLVLPNPNKAPAISITSPQSGALFVSPTNVTINATASDSDGMISKVEFFDNGQLIGEGTPTGNNQYVITKQNGSFGEHSLIAVATDNGGRQNISNAANVIVNGLASVTITTPSAGALFAPASAVTVRANANHPSGIINKVEFFANGESIGLGSLASGSQYNVAWNNPNDGIYALVAVATDGSGITTTSAPVTATVDTPPTVTMTTPADGSLFPSLTNISVSATAEGAHASIARVDFYANGIPIGSATDVGTDKFTATWRHLADGFYSITAVATDSLGVSTTSAPITVGVNTTSPQAGEFIWFDDTLPPGAIEHGEDTANKWYWVDANPGAFSGSKAHQSRNFGQLDTPNGFHQHYFDGATTTLPVSTGDKLFTYVFLDINNMPREIMLQWKDANSWEHRAYWGQNTISAGTDGTTSRRYMGPLPKASTWVRLEVPASAVGLEGSTLNGMAFTLDAGRATWDLAGKATSNATPPPTSPSGDSVWIEDGLPAGAVTATVNDQWNWVSNPLYSGQLAHQSQVSVNHNTTVYRSHSFTGAQTPMGVNPGDVLFTYVYLDPAAKPDQIMLQWYDGTGWEHRAFWGEDFIGQQFRTLGVQGTESQRYMGGLPPAGSWYRLEVPAGYVGLEGKSVSGMAFSVYGKEPTIAWDRSGKASALTTTPLLLSATTGVWRTFGNTYGYAYETNDLGPADHAQPKITFYAHPNQAAGTVPFYRFRRPDSANHEYFYSQSKSYDGNGWILDGTAFYVYPDATTPGTLPLYLYHDNQFHYFLTTDQSEATGMALDGISAYVTATNPLVPAAPSDLYWDGKYLRWKDNSTTETGFKIERVEWSGSEYLGTQIATVPANTTIFKVGSSFLIFFRIRATNSFGDSAYSNSVCSCWFDYLTSPNTPPDVSITSPGAGDTVGTDFTIAANAFDIDGNGTIAKVEFFANGNKLGEVGDAPFVFAWNNVASGTYSLTVRATDGTGASTTSSPISVTVDSAPSISITSPASGALLNSTTVTISASASDSDGTISKVEFFQGATKIGEVTTAPYNLVWSTVAGGSYLLTAVATDNLGRATVSSPVSISVNAPPTVSITTPAGGSIFTAPTDLTINASASDSDGTISKVEFYQGATLLGTVLTSPYSYTWSNAPAGTYSITAKATDNLGAMTTSIPVNITVNALPNVSISSPASGTTFFAPANVGINAMASDDGSISKVEFFQGTTLIGTVTASPYNLIWSNLPVGSYSLTAKATDNLGATRTSSSVNITVVQPNNSGKIAFASNRDGSAQIYSMNQDGSNLFRLTSDAANNECPRWSPNNSRIVFQSDRDNPFSGAAEIYVMNWDGSGQTRLTNNVYDDSAPVWSPDGTKIALQSARNGVNYQVYVMNADGSGQVNVSNSTANDIQPSWSPDGTKIAFASDRDQAGFSSIYVMNANGSNQTRLTTSGSGFRDDQPAWSPDGMKLAFTTTRDSTLVTWDEWDGVGNMVVKTNLLSNKEVYVMNADGSNPVRLTNTPENDDSPAWSGDGTKIVFRSDRARDCCDPVEQIWTMNADGTNQLDLSNNGSGDYCPSWSR